MKMVIFDSFGYVYQTAIGNEPGRRVDDALLATLPRLRLVAVAFTGAVMGWEKQQIG